MVQWNITVEWELAPLLCGGTSVICLLFNLPCIVWRKSFLKKVWYCPTFRRFKFFYQILGGLELIYLCILKFCYFPFYLIIGPYSPVCFLLCVTFQTVLPPYWLPPFSHAWLDWDSSWGWGWEPTEGPQNTFLFYLVITVTKSPLYLTGFSSPIWKSSKFTTAFCCFSNQSIKSPPAIRLWLPPSAYAQSQEEGAEKH